MDRHMEGVAEDKKKKKKRPRVEDGHCVIRCVGVEDAVDRPPVNFY